MAARLGATTVELISINNGENLQFRRRKRVISVNLAHHSHYTTQPGGMMMKNFRRREMMMMEVRGKPPCLTTAAATSSYPMNGGDGSFSYAHNSSMQKNGLEGAQPIISETIEEKFDIDQLQSSKPLFTIADLGCSVGPNTFYLVHNIIQSIKSKCSQSNSPEFQVFFNDHTSNDFNTLFTSLPSDKPYYAAGVPGSFHGRLFPQASLHFVHSSYALQWLSKMPKEVVEKGSPGWNKGRIFYPNAAKEVVDAYRGQFHRDMDVLLGARAEEVVSGGLMAFLLPTVPSGCKSILADAVDVLGSALMDMAHMGLISEAQVDAFNMPMYFPDKQDLEALVDKNGNFSIERMEILDNSQNNFSLQTLPMHLRAGWEGLVRESFSSEITEEAFDRFTKKLLESPILSDSTYKLMFDLLVILKRN